LRLKLVLQNWRGINHQVVIKFRQNLFKLEVKYYILKSMRQLILFEIPKNCLISGRSILSYQFSRKVIKLTVVIIGGYHYYQLRTKFYRIFFSED
jgi:hypothetical protein